MANASPVVSRVVKQRLLNSASSGALNAGTFENGIHIDFSTGTYYTKVPGQEAVEYPNLQSMFTFTGGNQSMYMGPNGVLIQSVTNTPRIEYDANGNCLGLLMEASKQNVALNSRDLSAGTWTKLNCTIGSATSIDGTSRNIQVVEATDVSQIHGVVAGMGITANSTNCLSMIVRPLGRQYCFIYGINTDQFGAVFDLVNLTSASFVSGTSTVSQHGVRALGNGSFLVWVSGVLNAASTTINFVAGPAASAAAPAGYTYNGTGITSVNIEYIQLETGSFPTSRIPTVGTAVTRTADVCTRTLGSEFSATAGTVVVQGRASGGQGSGVDQHVWSFDDGTTSETLRHIRSNLSDNSVVQVRDGAVTQAQLFGTFVNNTNFKNAFSWAADDFANSFNGAAVTTDAAGTLPTVTQLSLGHLASGSQMNGHIRRFDYFPKRESNARLQEMSA